MMPKSPRRLLRPIKKAAIDEEDAELRHDGLVLWRWRKESMNELWTNEMFLSLQHLDGSGFFSFCLQFDSLPVKPALNTSPH